MTQVSSICDKVGRPVVARRLGVGLTAVSNAVVAGVFPASWYAGVKSLCDERGIDCPMSAFNWKAVSGEAQDNPPNHVT